MGLIKRYGTTHFPMNGLSCNLQEYIRGIMLNIPTKFEVNFEEVKILVKF